MSDGRGVLLVGFGGPESLDRVPAFVESVLGRRPPPGVISSTIARYSAIGGGSPLPATTRRQAALLADELSRRGLDLPVYVGMLHAAPTVDEAVARIRAEGVSDLTVISLAPYRSEVSTDAYEAAVERALGLDDLRPRFTPDWSTAPPFVSALAAVLKEELRKAPAGCPVIFSAHSLPRRMIDQGDPYVDQLTATAEMVAEQVGLDRWYLAYQSVSAAASEPWLLPSVEQVIDRLAEDGATAVMVDPIGFVSDHVETLYDNDVEHRAHAEATGLAFYRCPCLNENPGLIETLADLVSSSRESG